MSIFRFFSSGKRQNLIILKLKEFVIFRVFSSCKRQKTQYFEVIKKGDISRFPNAKKLIEWEL